MQVKFGRDFVIAVCLTKYLGNPVEYIHIQGKPVQKRIQVTFDFRFFGLLHLCTVGLYDYRIGIDRGIDRRNPSLSHRREGYQQKQYEKFTPHQAQRFERYKKDEYSLRHDS